MEGQVELAEALRDHGMARAEVEAGEWKDTWRQTIELLAAIGDPFCSDDVRAIAGDPWDHPNACGALFNKAARDGIIRHVGYRRSDRPALHRHPVALWQGV